MSLTLNGSGPLVLPAASTLGASPATGDRTAAIATMQKFADEFSSNLVSGYQKLPSGLIIQWGYVNTGAADVQVTFPIAFPNNVLSISATAGAIGTGIFGNINSQSNLGMKVASWSASATRYGTTVFWIAIGN